MRVLMIAPPGAGKGTQGALIAAHFDIPHIATGELLRDHVARRTTRPRRPELSPTRRTRARPGRARHGAAGAGRRENGRRRVRAGRNPAQHAASPRGLPDRPRARDDRRCGAAPAGRRRGTHALLCASRARASLRRHRRHHRPAPRPLSRSDLPHPRVVPRPRNPGGGRCDALAHQVGREILTALEAMRPLLDHVPAQARRPVDLTTLGDAFGASRPRRLPIRLS